MRLKDQFILLGVFAYRKAHMKRNVHDYDSQLTGGLKILNNEGNCISRVKIVDFKTGIPVIDEFSPKKSLFPKILKLVFGLNPQSNFVVLINTFVKSF
jgi:hypothetical protein